MVHNILALNQYGDKLMLKGRFPRKELADTLGVHSDNLQKIYVDTNEGEAKHVGYIASGGWWHLYKITEWTGKA